MRDARGTRCEILYDRYLSTLRYGGMVLMPPRNNNYLTLNEHSIKRYVSVRQTFATIRQCACPSSTALAKLVPYGTYRRTYDLRLLTITKYFHYHFRCRMPNADHGRRQRRLRQSHPILCPSTILLFISSHRSRRIEFIKYWKWQSWRNWIRNSGHHHSSRSVGGSMVWLG